MKVFFYPRLAIDGMKKNRRLYLPYLLTCIGMVLMFFTLLFLSESPAVRAIRGANTVTALMLLGSWVIALFSLLFLFYTHSFLMRRRKKEFALYNILGMGKKNIAKVLLWETVILLALSLSVGLVGGVLFSKVAEWGLLRLLQAESYFSLSLSDVPVLRTVWVFSAIFLLQFFSSLKQIAFAKPCDLAKSENVGEKPPKANLLLGFGGFFILGIAYYMAVSIQNPLDALVYFFVAVLLVIVATYLLFIAGSVLVCKLLQKKKSYYYQPKHFVSVSSMAHRMKRNGAGLASVCILATTVLVMLSSSSCLFFGKEDALNRQYPREVIAEYFFPEPDLFRKETCDRIKERVLSAPGEKQKVSALRYFYTTGLWDEKVQIDSSSLGTVDYTKLYSFFFVEAEDYNAMTGADFSLQENEVVLICDSRIHKENLSFSQGPEWKILSCQPGNFGTLTHQMTAVSQNIVVVVNGLDQALEQFPERLLFNLSLTYQVAFDTPLSYEEKTLLCDAMEQAGWEEQIPGYSVSFKDGNRQDFFGTYGGLFYLGILLSIVFLLATVLILYYKQIAEGYEDQSRFEVMQKVGMTEKDIRSSINSQLMLVFFLPLLMAGLHTALAFPMVHKLLLLFNLNQIGLFVQTTLMSFVIFGIFYYLVYRVTSKAYLTIVKRK